eukprot:CAMPEP_0174262240 /NCGR_PEP_ID=MMETSP0439-20130205/12859_1 /TAXON_ID=0 /ORGANISM="Stereomyxa ramosa, Strain Chinc5" /LENGTH=641 /DNA_ID=CAMNT_0015346921 /DNA_START=20 /DNA_END=1942 /DNA_ORIENTATION=-
MEKDTPNVDVTHIVKKRKTAEDGSAETTEAEHGLGDSLRFSQIARILGDSTVSQMTSSNMMNDSMGSGLPGMSGGLGSSTDFSWNMLVDEDRDQVKDTEENEGNDNSSEKSSATVDPMALFGNGTQIARKFSDSPLLNQTGGQGLTGPPSAASATYTTTTPTSNSFLSFGDIKREEPEDALAQTSTQKPNIRKPLLGMQPSEAPQSPTRPPIAPLQSNAIRSATPLELINQLAHHDVTVENQLKAMRFRQRRVLENYSDQAGMDNLIKNQEQLKRQIDHSISQLKILNDMHILPAPEAYKLWKMLDSFDLHSRKLKVFQEEIFAFRTNPNNPEPVASLVITAQPFPCTVKQSKSVDDPVEVSLFTGARADLHSLGIVKAELINEDYNPVSKKKNAAPSIRNAEEKMDETGVCRFKQLIFPHGSRVKSVNMRFATEVNLSGRIVRLQSDASKPFIVMTNHGQRSTTEGKLLKKNTFYGRSEIPWPAFANAMQLHYLRATKQDPLKPKRPLSPNDIQYLHLNKFGGKLTVNQEEYDGFWAWFGTILYKVRNHQKHILPMWREGLIYGFLSRDDADTLLKDPAALAGCFLVRFSDRCEGQFVVVYVEKDEGKDKKEIKHYLVKQEDIEKKSTLPDFLRDCDNLW